MNCPHCGASGLPVPRFCCFCGAPLYENSRGNSVAAAAPAAQPSYPAPSPRAQAPAASRPAAARYPAGASSVQAAAPSRPAAVEPQSFGSARQSAVQYRSPASSVRMPTQAPAQNRQSAAQYRSPASSVRMPAQSQAQSRQSAAQVRSPASGVGTPAQAQAARSQPPASSAPPVRYSVSAPPEPSYVYGEASTVSYKTAMWVALTAVFVGLLIIIMAVLISSSSRRTSYADSPYATQPFAVPRTQAYTQENPLVGTWISAGGTTLVFTENTVREYDSSHDVTAQYTLVDSSHITVISGGSSKTFSFQISGDTLTLIDQQEPSQPIRYARVRNFTNT